MGAVCAATSLLITIHPQMVDVASMSQFLLMTSDLLSVVRNAGGDLNHDFIRYVITRHEPHDGPQAQIVALLRSLFGDEVLAATVLKSTAIADAGLTKQTLYEIERGQVRRSTFDRAIESLDAVNGEILDGSQKGMGQIMSRRDKLTGIFGDTSRELAAANFSGEGTSGRILAGPVRTMGLALDRMDQEARELQEALLAGEQVVELDPALVDGSFVRDRLDGEVTEDDDLVKSIERTGRKFRFS